MTPELVLFLLLQRAEHRYRALSTAHAHDLRAGRNATVNRLRMLYYAREVVELRGRLAGQINPCY